MKAQPAASLQSSHLRLVRERPEFQFELFSEIYREMVPLSRRNYAEIGPEYEAAEFDPDFDRYFEYERAGILKIWTARQDGLLIGYVVCFIVHGLHAQRSLRCYADVLYLAPEWRNGLLGLRFLRAIFAPLREMGVRALRWETNDLYEPDGSGRSRVAILLERIGFEQIGTVFQKVLT